MRQIPNLNKQKGYRKIYIDIRECLGDLKIFEEANTKELVGVKVKDESYDIVRRFGKKSKKVLERIKNEQNRIVERKIHENGQNKIAERKIH